jgi:outer membrane protein OmpA-like peptidoglycan-associated protein
VEIDPDPILAAVKRGTVQLTAFVGSAGDQPVVDQDMSVYYDKGTKEPETDPERLRNGFDANLKPVRDTVGQAAGNQSHLDLLSLLGIIAHTPSPATVLIYSSGLQTTGLLDLREQGSDLDVAATVDRLPKDQLPDLTGKALTFIGLGQVAGPQSRLTEKMRTDIEKLWLAVCQKANGTCDPNVRQSTGGPPRSTTAVPTIPVPTLGPVTVSPPDDPAVAGQTSTIRLPNGIFFHKNAAEFLPGAEEKLAGMVGYFLPDSQTVPVAATAVGHAASYGRPEGARTISRQRAQRVVDALVKAGVDRSIFTTVDGVGFDQPLVPDLDANGKLIPEAAEQNRTVVLTVTRSRSAR